MRTAKSAKMRRILGATLVATILPVMSNAGQITSSKVESRVESGDGFGICEATVLTKSSSSAKNTRVAAGITAGGLAGITAGGVSGITAGGLAGITAGGVSGITAGGLVGITAGGVSGITAGGLVGITAGGVSGITAGGLVGITAGGVSGITAGGLAGITAGGVSGITAGGLVGITAGGVSGITAGGLAGITAGGVSGITAGGLVGITAGGVSGITAGGLAGITAGGVSGITAGGLVGITAGGVSGITAGGLSGVTAGGIASLTSAQFDSDRIQETSAAILSGPVENIDAINGVFTSMGQTVLASQSMLSSLAVGDLVTVDGSVMGAGWIYADTLEVSRDTYVPGATPVLVTGLISEMDQSIGRAQVGALEVDYTATLSGGDMPRANFYRFYGIQPEGKGVMLSDLILTE